MPRPDIARTDAHREAFLRQATSCQSLGSPMYAALFQHLGAQCTYDSPLAELLGDSTRPVHDAVPLRLAGAVHRQVLTGSAVGIHRHYPSVGGTPDVDFPEEFLSYLTSNPGLVRQALNTQVQTNEVRRSIALRQASRWLASRGCIEFNLYEIGCSAGLNLLFDMYPSSWFLSLETAASTRAPLDLARHDTRVLTRAGCDLHPLDVRNDDDMSRLRSFVWPDQMERHIRLQHAIEIAASVEVPIEQSSADEWVRNQLSSRTGPTVVFHSIVWQYLGADVQSRLRQALAEHGARASSSEPLVWLRMEPNGPTADLRATVWDGSPTQSDHVLADVGYHGESFIWRVSNGV